MSSTRRNVLMFLTDQHNPKIAGYAGDPWVSTPAMDSLAATGTIFGAAYCQAPLCVPSRTAMLTGMHCRTTGVYDNRDILESHAETFPRVLGRAGYRTCLIGKAHLNGDQFQGFQQRPYGDLFGQAHQPDPRRLPANYEHGLGDIPSQAGPSGIPIQLTQTELCVSESTRWLSEHVALHRDQPFLLAVHFDKPHFPINPPRHLFEKYMDLVSLSEHWEGEHGPDHLSRLTPFVRSNFVDEGYYDAPRDQHRKALAAYYGCVEWVDDAMKRVLDVVSYLGLGDDTAVVYASDHGEMASAHGAWQKMVFYEESVRVPLIIRHPDQQTSGRAVTAPVALIDLFPTFCDIAGAPIPESCEGISLAPTLLEGTEITGRDAVFSESVLIGKPAQAGCMIRYRKWKYALYLDGTEELYDLENDPGEHDNRSTRPGDAPIREMRKRIEDFWRPDEQIARYEGHARMRREKHFYPYSNQFVGAAGTVFDARP